MLGFIGVGVMGEPMCRNLAQKSGEQVCAFDMDDAPLERLGEVGVYAGESIADIGQRSDIVFLSLPGRTAVQKVCIGGSGLLSNMRPGSCVVDLSTTSVSLAKDLHARFGARGIEFCDAPVARTRQAAQDGTLSIMVGGPEKAFDRIRPLLERIATDITHCGPAGSGQTMKIINNMVLFQNVVALAEALALIRHSGIRPELAFEVLSKGSADSFALRNHGMKAMLPGKFPERAYSTLYALKDVRYALELARDAGVELSGASNARTLLKRASEAGFGEDYFPVLAKVIAKAGAKKGQ
ncbi:MAG: NAD(P)-dependent oxidoreductase [Betaproteobacteria bacterium]